MILVAGGGPAGAAAAILLSRAGREVVLVEREASPTHKICGEFLSTEAQGYLAALGLDVAALGGHRITHVRLIRGRRAITARLPFEGLGITRRLLDEALLDHAAAAGVQVRRGEAVRRIHGLEVEVGGETLLPEILLLATGKHDARGAPRDARPSDLVGFKNYFRLAPAQRAGLAAHVELILFPGGYAGLELVENGLANLSLLVEREVLRRAGGNWDGLMAALLREVPHLALRLGDAEAVLEAPLTIARVPYGFVHRAGAGDSEAVFRLGDQAAVIQSFTGDGMSMALHSAVLAAGCMLAGEGAAEYHHRFAAGVRGQVWRAGALHGLLRSPWLGGAAFAGAAVFPKLLAVAAAVTRVPERERRGKLQHPM